MIKKYLLFCLAFVILFFYAGVATTWAAGPSLLHTVSGGGSTGSGGHYDLTVPATSAGSLLVAFVTSGSTIASVSDTLNGTWSTIPGVSACSQFGSYACKVFYFCNSIAGATAVSDNQSAFTAGDIVYAEYSGIASSTCVDQSTTLGSWASSGTWSSPNITTTQANELLVGAIWNSDPAATLTGANGFTQEISGGGVAVPTKFGLEDRIVASAGSYTAQGIFSSGGAQGAAVAFKTTGGISPTPTPTPTSTPTPTGTPTPSPTPTPTVTPTPSPTPTGAKSWYVDSSVATSGNGQSWSTAWKNVTNVTGVSAGDTVYISGGSISQVYPLAAPWQPAGGVNGNPVTYKVGQDAGHTGMVIFDGSAGAGAWMYGPGNWVTVDGGYAGSRHMQLQNFTQTSEYVVAPSSQGLVIKYVTFQPGDAVTLNAASYYEIAFCIMESTVDHAIVASAPPPATGFGINKIHDNIITIDQKNDGSGFGSDGIQNANALDLYNNTFIGKPTPSYIYGQHQDGIQTSALYVRVYNNTFEDIGNYAVFFEAFGDMPNMQVFNNVMFMSDTRFVTGFQRAIAIGRSGGATGTVHFNNIVVANNTVANYYLPGISLTANSQTVWNSSDLVYNNASYAAGGIDVDPNIAGAASATNKAVTTGGLNIFVNYQPLSGTDFPYDFHLKSTDTTFKDQGVSSASAYFSTDKEGVFRPQGSNWDIGAYEVSSGTGGTPLAGDLNLDHIINALDYSIMNAHWLQNYSQADINSDGLVNSIDFAVLKSNWGKTW